MAHENLREQVCRANLALARSGLVVLTWGNASGVDRAAGVMAIKPSGVDYDDLAPEHMVLVDLKTGRPIDGSLKPSSDTPTHVELYRAFDSVGGVVHTHSIHATAWAQACREIPCLGTTHADLAYGPIPLTRPLTPEETTSNYEANTGKVIVERFQSGGLDPREFPAVLVAHHGPFTWGADAAAAVEHAIALEAVAQMALGAVALDPQRGPIPRALLDKHFLRKHGSGAYYGQKR